MKTHAKLSYMSRCYAALKVNQHFNHETKNDFFQELETSIFKKTIFSDGMPITLHQRIIIRELPRRVSLKIITQMKIKDKTFALISLSNFDLHLVQF